MHTFENFNIVLTRMQTRMPTWRNTMQGFKVLAIIVEITRLDAKFIKDTGA